MDIFVNEEITNVLEKHMKKFYSCVLDEDNDYFDYYKKLNNNQKFNNFMWTILEDKSCFKNYYNILIKSHICKKEINEFFYKYLKMKQKSKKKLWSFSEIEEFKIDDLDINIENKYKFF
tara:strand:+ start:531 stop:887 length:357 start_codon:yes stop_codon:yes gene_type:complete